MNTRNINTQQGNTGITIVAVFRDPDDAEGAVKDLRDAGFTSDQIGIAGPHKGRGFFDKLSDFFSGGGDETNYSDFAGSVSQYNVPREQAEYIELGVRSGGTLVIVKPDGARQADAMRILEEHDGDLGTDMSRRTSSADTASVRAGDGEQRIRLLGETLRIHKDRIARGEVRLRKEVVSEQQNVQVPVTREELVIERMPAQGREAEPGESIGAKTDEIRVPLSEERVRVEKKPVVQEEIAVGKRQVQDTRQVSDTLRREQMRVEREGEVSEAEVEDQPKRKKTA